MQYTYEMTIWMHIFVICILIISYLYLYVVINIVKKTRDIARKFKSFLPFIYINISILFFTGLALSMINSSLGVLNINTAFVYMLLATIFLLVSSIKLFKKAKIVNIINYKIQSDFLEFSKKIIMINMLVLLAGFFI